MTETDAPSPPGPARRVWPIVITAIVVVSVAGAAGVYAARRAIAREALIGWLAARGVEAQVDVRAFDPGGFTGKLRIGPASAPDLTAEAVELRYGLQGFWTGDPLGVRIISVRLQRPVLRGSWRKGVLRLGELDPIIEEFRRQPPRPSAAKPLVIVDDARLQLDSDYGLVRVRASARVDNGKLATLTARFEPMVLRGPGLSAILKSADLRLATRGDRVDVALDAPLSLLRTPDLAVEDGVLHLTAQAPYPDLERRRGDGRLSLRLTASAAKLALGETRLIAVRQDLAFDGAVTGWIDSLAVTGVGRTGLQSERAALPGMDARQLSLAGDVTDLKWTRAGGDNIQAGLHLRPSADGLDQADLRLAGLTGAFQGIGSFGRGGEGLHLRGAIAARGGWTGLGPVTAQDPAETAALKRALAGFTFRAPALAVDASGRGLTLGLPAPARLSTAGGGAVTLQALGAAPLFSGGRGAFRLAVRGAALPSVDLVVDRFAVGPGATTARGRLQAQGSFGAAQGAEMNAGGVLTLAGGSTTFAAAGCVPLRVRHLELGANDVEAVDGELCPVAAPLVTLQGGRWRLRARAKALEATVPFLEAKIAEAAGPLDFTGSGQALSGVLDLKTARLEDTAAPTRFQPLGASGRARLAGGVWRADLALTDPAGRAVGQAVLHHDMASGDGGVSFNTGTLAFAEGGLQPAALSPLAAALGSPATGQARFTGQAAWTPQAATSGGTLTVDRLDFRSPAGAVTGLSGQVVLTSLAPLAAAPGQVLRAEKVDLGMALLTTPQVTFSLADEALVVAGAQVGLSGGQVTLQALSIPLAPGKPWRGVVDFQDVQLADLVEASPFGDRMDLTAKVTGKAPFEVTPTGVRITKGELRAVEPGRLSILRQALGAVAADGAASAPASGAIVPQTPDTITDFAYQAMENLAFERLDAEVNSLPEGRLGILFHIKGEHAPPKAQQITLSLRDLITRDFMKRSLPLPSGTKVDLTLDTSLNLDKLLADYGDFQRLRGSRDVQAPSSTIRP